MQDNSDEPIAGFLKAAALRDQVAFAELYRITNRRLYAVAMRIARDADTAQEALQEAYMRIWTEAARFDAERGRPLTWMYTILRHTCIDLVRKRDRSPPTEELDAADLALPAHGQDALDLVRCLANLGAVEARAIKLTIEFGLSHTELAQAFAMPLGTVKTIVRRGLLKLRACLGVDYAVAVEGVTP